MNGTVEQMEAFQVMGVEKRIGYENAYQEIPAFWNEFCRNCRKDSSAEGAMIGKYGVCVEDDKASFSYLIAGDYEGGAVPEGLKVVQIPAGTWAKFQCVGPLPGALQSVNSRIYKEWLPGNQEYQPAFGIHIERYHEGDIKADDYISEIWIPVKEK